VTDGKSCVRLKITQPREETSMTMSSHLNELKKKHQTLSDAVEAAQRTLSSDDIEIAKLKKQKLQIKEEIARLSA